MIKFRAKEACSLKLSGGNGSTGVRGELATWTERSIRNIHYRLDRVNSINICRISNSRIRRVIGNYRIVRLIEFWPWWSTCFDVLWGNLLMLFVWKCLFVSNMCDRRISNFIFYRWIRLLQVNSFITDEFVWLSGEASILFGGWELDFLRSDFLRSESGVRSHTGACKRFQRKGDIKTSIS